MTNREVDALLERVSAWSEDAQAELLRAALAIDLNSEPDFVLDLDDVAALARSRDDVANNRFANETEMRRLLHSRG